MEVEILLLILSFFQISLSSSSIYKEDDSQAEEVEVAFLVKDLKGGSRARLDYRFSSQTLRNLNATLSEIMDSWIEVERNGTAMFVTSAGRRISTIPHAKDISETIRLKLVATVDQNINLTMNDIINDPELEPIKVPLLKWAELRFCSLKRILISQLYIKVNNMKIPLKYEDGDGLFLTSINPNACAVTFQKLFYTNDFGVYRDLVSVVESLLPGRVVILVSQSEGSFLLPSSARRALSNIGSFFVEHYLYGDAWLWVFIKDGPSLGEALVPNFGTAEKFVNLPAFELLLPKTSEKNSSLLVCPKWPINEKWNARRTFCQLNDAIRGFCDCNSPFQFPATYNTTEKPPHQFIPIIILCGRRGRSLLRLLESLAIQKSLNKTAITLVLDGDQQDIRKLAFILDLRIIVHKPVGYNSIRVSRNLRFGLFNALKIFPESETFIILEDDLLLSPDFYSYMSQLSPVFKLDPSIYTVSGFNYLSSPTSSQDPTLTYRIDGHPAYGWMMPRTIIEEFLPKWPHKVFHHDWDLLFATDMFRRGRQCVVPDVNRVYHNCLTEKGVHVTPSWYSDRQFLQKGLNNLTDVLLQPINRILKLPYENEMNRLLSSATVVKVEDVYNITLPESKTGVYVIFALMNSISDYDAFKLIGDSLGTWIGKPLFHMYDHTWRLFCQGYPLFVVGVPFSNYSRYMSNSTSVFSIPPGGAKHLLNDKLAKDKIPIITHGTFFRQEWKSRKRQQLSFGLNDYILPVDQLSNFESEFFL